MDVAKVLEILPPKFARVGQDFMINKWSCGWRGRKENLGVVKGRSCNVFANLGMFGFMIGNVYGRKRGTLAPFSVHQWWLCGQT